MAWELLLASENTHNSNLGIYGGTMMDRAFFSKLRLRSPDSGKPLCKRGGGLEDEDGNHYTIIDGIPDLRPLRPIEGTLRYKLCEHDDFRTYCFQRSLTPLFPTQVRNSPDIKETNVSGFVPPPHNGAFCLDHGCGGGKFRRLLEAFGYEYVGVDNEIGASANQGGGGGFLGGATILGDLHRLPFEEGTFQFAVSYSVFEHLQNPFIAAHELFRVMEPGGICFVAIAALIPFHMDSFYHHTHFGVLNTFKSAGFLVEQVAGANWNAYKAISSMDGLPGPKLIRNIFGGLTETIHRTLWGVRARLKGVDLEAEELRRHLLMAALIKTVLIKPPQNV